MSVLLCILAPLALVLSLVSVIRNRALLYDPHYQCLTRQGLERRWNGKGAAIFLDVDNMRHLNTTYGYRAVDARIAGALAAACRKDEAYAARWASGDEIVIKLEELELVPIVLPRLHEALTERGLSAPLVPVPAERSLEATIAKASDLVQEMKRRRPAQAQEVAHA